MKKSRVIISIVLALAMVFPGISGGLLTGAPVYADIFQTIAIAEALLEKGAYLGVILAFMMSITTLSLPSLIMLKKIIKGKLFFAFLAICLVGIMIVGYMFNIIQNILLI